MLLNRGLPVNLFLREGGMDDLVRSFVKQIQDQIKEILKSVNLIGAREEAGRDVKKAYQSVHDNLSKNPELQSRLLRAIEEGSLDQLFRLKFDLRREIKLSKIVQKLDRLIHNKEELELIISGENKYTLSGTEKIKKKDALNLLSRLEELEKLTEALINALKNGDLFNFNLENLAKYLGPESYQEFLERREEIFKKLKELMESKGLIVENIETGKAELSPRSIRKIGRRAVEEIFTHLKADSSGGTHAASESGQSDNVSSVTRLLEFGDPISNIDITSSILNSLIRSGNSRPGFNDIEIFTGRGRARSAVVILLDMSGSMMRSDRFFNAKKMVLALDSLIREDFRDDRLMIVGFGRLAKVFQPAQVPTLQPYPVTMFHPHIRLRIDLARIQDDAREYLPLYFTNLQRGLALSRNLLGSGETKNKQIILITDGVPTAHHDGNQLHINYPPSPADFEAALKEVNNCSEDGIIINTFLLASDWEMDYFGEESFIHQFAAQSMGRIFYPHPGDLGKMVLVDFIANRKTQFNY